MLLHYIFLALLILATFCLGCTEALPKKNPEGEISKSLAEAINTEEQINQAVASAHRDREHAETILLEAKKLLNEAIVAQNKCELSFVQIEKIKKNMAKARACIAQPKESTKLEMKHEVKSGDPEYSPSDAPVGWKK